MNEQPTLTALARAGQAMCRIAAFGVLGALSARRVSTDPAALLAGSLCAVALAEFFLRVLGLVAGGGVQASTPDAGKPASKVARLGRGFVTMTPFAVLAVVAEFALGWDAVQTFVAAGITASVGAAAAELASRGASQVRSALATAVVGMAFTSSWMLITVLAKTIATG